MSDARRDWMPPPRDGHPAPDPLQPHRRRPQVNGKDHQHQPNGTAALDRLTGSRPGFFSVASTSQEIIPPRQWLMDQWIPAEQATGIYGEGGIGKTDWLLQLCICKSLGLPFCGVELEPGVMLGYFVEDTRDELLRRCRRICDGLKIVWEDVKNFHLISLVGMEYTEIVESIDANKLTATPNWVQLEADIDALKPAGIVLDTLPDFAGFNENVRNLVAKFGRKLDALSYQKKTAIIVSAHPSQAGTRDGTLTSGTTGWVGKLRSRLGITDPGVDQDDGEQRRGPAPASDVRIITRFKANYARRGEQVRLIYRDGFFWPADLEQRPARTKGALWHAECEARFLTLLEKMRDEGRTLSDTVNAKDRYAPLAMRKRDSDFTKQEYAQAMDRLLAADRIHVGTEKYSGHNRAMICLGPKPERASKRPKLVT